MDANIPILMIHTTSNRIMSQKKERLRVPLRYLAEVTGYTDGYVKHRTAPVEEAERLLYPLIRQAIQRAKAEFDDKKRKTH